MLSGAVRLYVCQTVLKKSGLPFPCERSCRRSFRPRKAVEIPPYLFSLSLSLSPLFILLHSRSFSLFYSLFPFRFCASLPFISLLPFPSLRFSSYYLLFFFPSSSVSPFILLSSHPLYSALYSSSFWASSSSLSSLLHLHTSNTPSCSLVLLFLPLCFPCNFSVIYNFISLPVL